MGNIETLFHCVTIVSRKAQVILLGCDSLTWLLPIGKHQVSVTNVHLNKKCRFCSLIPIGGASKVTTDGLKWELNDTLLAFGVLVSTSNEPVKDVIQIDVTEHPVLWSMILE